MSPVGPIITDDMVEDAVVSHLKTWLPSYLAEVEDAVPGVERGFYKRPPGSSYTTRADFDKWPEEMLPAIVVVSPGIDDDPVKDGRGNIRAQFQIGVVAVVSSTDQVATRRYAYRMGAAIRGVLIQKPSLGQAFNGAVRGIDWVGSRNNELPDSGSADRSIWACQQLFIVEVDGLLSKRGGLRNPLDPDTNYAPEPGDPTVDNVNQPVGAM